MYIITEGDIMITKRVITKVRKKHPMGRIVDYWDRTYDCWILKDILVNLIESPNFDFRTITSNGSRLVTYYVKNEGFIRTERDDKYNNNLGGISCEIK
jgi:hypothetical protein